MSIFESTFTCGRARCNIVDKQMSVEEINFPEIYVISASGIEIQNTSGSCADREFYWSMEK